VTTDEMDASLPFDGNNVFQGGKETYFDFIEALRTNATNFLALAIYLFLSEYRWCTYKNYIIL